MVIAALVNPVTDSNSLMRPCLSFSTMSVLKLSPVTPLFLPFLDKKFMYYCITTCCTARFWLLHLLWSFSGFRKSRWERSFWQIIVYLREKFLKEKKKVIGCALFLRWWKPDLVVENPADNPTTCIALPVLMTYCAKCVWRCNGSSKSFVVITLNAKRHMMTNGGNFGIIF